MSYFIIIDRHITDRVEQMIYFRVVLSCNYLLMFLEKSTNYTLSNVVSTCIQLSMSKLPYISKKWGSS